MIFNLGPLKQRLTDQDFEQICAQNPDYRIELTKEGQLIVMLRLCWMAATGISN